LLFPQNLYWFSNHHALPNSDLWMPDVANGSGPGNWIQRAGEGTKIERLQESERCESKLWKHQVAAKADITPSTLPQHPPSLPIVPLAAQINHFLNTTAVEIMLSH
jgi:hypothetical protein